jgi:hypothetical protein
LLIGAGAELNHEHSGLPDEMGRTGLREIEVLDVARVRERVRAP